MKIFNCALGLALVATAAAGGPPLKAWIPDGRACIPSFNRTAWSTCTSRGHGLYGNGDYYCSRARHARFVCGIKIHANGTAHSTKNDTLHLGDKPVGGKPYDEGVKGIMLKWCDRLSPRNETFGPFYGQATDSDQEHYYWWNTTTDDPITHVWGTSDDKVQMLQFRTLSGRRSPQWGHHGNHSGQRRVWEHDLGDGLTGISGSSGDVLDSVSFQYKCSKKEEPVVSATPAATHPAQALEAGDIAYSLELQPCGHQDGFQSWSFGDSLFARHSNGTLHVKTKSGKISTKKKVAHGHKAFKNIEKWVNAIKAARKELGLTGFVAIKKGSELYNKTKALYES
jgi:hypothetical protein